MPNHQTGRRAFLTALAGGAGFAGAGVVSGATDETGQRTSTYAIRPGTRQETRAYVVDAEYRGPTALVVGGVHGDERAGYLAAEEVVSTDIDAGRLVVIPNANAVAVERGSRHGLEGDLNRAFPTDGSPETTLARAIWSFVESVDPDAVVDLHTSHGLYGREPEGVGQAIHHSHDDAATRMARDIAPYVNERYDIRPYYEFETVPLHFSGRPADLLVERTDRNLSVDAPSLLAEAYRGVPLDDRVAWLHRIAVAVLGELGVIN